MFPCKATLYLAPMYDEEYLDRCVLSELCQRVCVCVCVCVCVMQYKGEQIFKPFWFMCGTCNILTCVKLVESLSVIT